ncbi:hypothetical protein GPJ56_001033 [Histomonas meleagridis]|uniref:uncharacterized protein n=1 Tax=Histomonas meleagridis TaxID=135588 RepID=UPI00355A36E8|nr:hypothetical protein GPJ56_001033 [Histomonas meleagridis]KAH0804656.1 hypothetical protein GO595_002521 [Histomonas meleagridis]
MIGPKKLKATSYEKLILGGGCYCQLALKVKPTKVNEIVHEIAKKAVGCRTLFDGQNYIYTPLECPVFRIPNNFPSLEEAQIYASTYYTVPLSQRLASICYNDDTVILHNIHSSCDGGYLKIILNYLIGGDVPPGPEPYIHESASVTFNEVIKSVNGHRDYNTTKVIGTNPSIPTDPKVTAYYYPVNIDFSDMSTHSSGSLRGLTDLLWSSMILTVSASNGKFYDAKVENAVDTRRVISNPGWKHANENTVICVYANDLTEDSSISEMCDSLRKDFNKKITNKEVIKSIRDLMTGYSRSVDYATCGISNIGPLKTGGDIVDVTVGTSFVRRLPPPGGVYFHTISIDDKMFKGRMYSSPFTFSRNETRKLADAMRYCLTKVKKDMKIGDVVKDLQQMYGLGKYRN